MGTEFFSLKILGFDGGGSTKIVSFSVDEAETFEGDFLDV